MQITVKVKTRQKFSAFGLDKKQEYLASLKSPPENNQANIELLDLAANYFHVAKNSVTIKSGKHARRKILIINQ